MRIGNNYQISFQGKFYAMTDGHSRIPMIAGVLTEIEKQSQNSNEPQFYIDGGDLFGEAMPLETVSDVFIKFHERNPKVQMVFNVGNVETDSVIAKNKPQILENINKMAKSGINFVSLTMKNLLKQKDMDSKNFLPYIMLEDIHNGKKEKILVSGVNEYSIADEKSDKEDMKKLLKEELLPVFKEQRPDKTILMCHTMTKNTDELLDYAKEIGIDNIELVVGGHPHSIEDYEHNGARVLYPPAQGKGAYIINNTENGIEFDKVPRLENGYIYDPVAKSSSTIPNIDVNNPLPIDNNYRTIVYKGENNPLLNKVATAPFSLKFRNDYDFENSEPTELGTFIANGYRDCAGADIGLSLSMDLRERAPLAGQVVTEYNINDVLNAQKDIYMYEGITADELKGMFEVSLLHQADGITNKDFFEYSDNLKIARKTNTDGDKVVQIYIKDKDGEFTPLLDEKTGKQLSNRKFTVATCYYVAKTPRNSLKYFAQFPSKKVANLTARGCFASQYKKYEHSGLKEFKASEIIDV